MGRLTERAGGLLGRLGGLGGLGNGKWRRFVIIAGIAAIALLFLSTVIPEGSPAQEQGGFSEDASALEQELEKRLTDIISQIDGVTSPQVMVTLDRTSERVFAEEVKSSSSGDSQSAENSPALTGSKDALEKSVILPRVRGVAVVCGGAENVLIREKVVNTAARVLDIGVSQVYVTN